MKMAVENKEERNQELILKEVAHLTGVEWSLYHTECKHEIDSSLLRTCHKW